MARGVWITMMVMGLLAAARSAAADPVVSGPPGLLEDGPGVNLTPATYDAPIQDEVTPGLALLRQFAGRETLRFRNGSLVIDFDGSITLTPLYSVFTIRFGGSNPYSYEIRQAVASTFDYRAGIRARYRAAAMEFALTDLPRYLDAVWMNPAWSPRERREILFALWDECAETGEDLVGRGGRQARAVIEMFIRHRLPIGSADGFSAAELARFNSRRVSAQRFRPYRHGLTIPGKTVALALTF